MKIRRWWGGFKFIPFSLCNNSSNECSIDIKESTFLPTQIPLGKLRKSNAKGLIIALPKVNSLRKKFDSLKCLVAKMVYIFIISETEIESIFLAINS